MPGAPVVLFDATKAAAEAAAKEPAAAQASSAD